MEPHGLFRHTPVRVIDHSRELSFVRWRKENGEMVWTYWRAIGVSERETPTLEGIIDYVVKRMTDAKRFEQAEALELDKERLILEAGYDAQ